MDQAQSDDASSWLCALQTTFPLCPGHAAGAAMSTHAGSQEHAENSAAAVCGRHRSEVRTGQSVLKQLQTDAVIRLMHLSISLCMYTQNIPSWIWKSTEWDPCTSSAIPLAWKLSKHFWWTLRPKWFLDNTEKYVILCYMAFQQRSLTFASSTYFQFVLLLMWI